MKLLVKASIYVPILSSRAAFVDNIPNYDKSKGLAFVETSRFLDSAEAIQLSDESIREVQSKIVNNPDYGVSIQGVPDARKIRINYIPRNGGKAKGTRSGLRAVYVVVLQSSYVFLLDIFYKKNKLDLTATDKKRLNKIIAEIKEEQ